MTPPETEERPDGEKPTPAAQPAGPVEVRLFGRTDVGLVREHNEDSFLVLRLDDGKRVDGRASDAARNVNADAAALNRHDLGARGTLLVVCDGMGGAAAGEVASSMAVDSVAEAMLGDAPLIVPDGVVDDAKTALGRKLRGAAQLANERIFKEARQNLSRSGMGTTMTAVTLSDRHAVIAQVGDSRAYVWRAGRFTQVTRDQSLVNQLLETGQITPEQAKFFEHSNVILQALGVQEEVDVQLSLVELRRGDRILVCSDGLVGVVSDEDIAAVVGGVDDPEEATRQLCEIANAGGGPDNISVIIAHLGGPALREPTTDDQLEYAPWRIDPMPPADAAPPQARDTITAEMNVGAARAAAASEGRDLPTPTDPHRVLAAVGQRPLRELVSMAVVVGLVVGSVVTGAALYGNAVPCVIQTQTAGLAVLADGRETGERTADGEVEVRLKPGRHLLELRGPGASDAMHEVNVSEGAVCRLSFGPPR